jgi:predicted metal-dependent hydrolase
MTMVSSTRSTRLQKANVITEKRTIEISGISVEIVRKDIKNLHMGVYPPKGRVRVAAPMRLNDEAVRLAVVSRLGWIRRQQHSFDQQDRQSERAMVTGESHFYRGRRYRLNVVQHDGPPSIRLRNNTTIELRIRPQADREAREAVLLAWYRSKLREQLPTLLAKWQPEIGGRMPDLRIKKMKTRWGTCNQEARRIWLNLELAKKPPTCVQYIFVHEMVHLVERHHNDRFRSLMDKFMPQWRHFRDELNRAPLAHEDWDY